MPFFVLCETQFAAKPMIHRMTKSCCPCKQKFEKIMEKLSKCCFANREHRDGMMGTHRCCGNPLWMDTDVLGVPRDGSRCGSYKDRNRGHKIWHI